MFNFNRSEMPEPKNDFEPVPAGWYEAVCVECELRETKKRDGEYLNFRWDIEGPKYAGRVLFGSITTDNPNPKAVEVGTQQVAQLMDATSMEQFSKPDQVIGKRALLKVTVKNDPEYGSKNEIRGYKKPESKLGGAATGKKSSGGGDSWSSFMQK